MYMKVVQYTDIIGFRTYHVHVLKCLPDTRYKHNLEQTVLNNVLRLRENT